MDSVKAPKKLIEVALPLDAINVAAAREKSIRHGHPSTLHLWWARRPLAAARAVIFAQMVNDPSWRWELEHPGEIPPSNLKASWAASRKRLFALIEDLVKWENTTNEAVLEKARAEIRKSWRETCELNKDHPRAAELFDPDRLPAFHDPFAGGGALPLEAQRLGLEAYASDLNPVAVLINKAMIEILPRFADRAPVHPAGSADGKSRTNEEGWFKREWTGAQGLAEDVRYYGQWMREEAQRRIGHLYPPVEVTAEMAADPINPRPDLKQYVGRKLTVIAWIWARTVKSPNPAFRHVDVPLASTFILSSKTGKEAYVEPVIEGESYRFTVKMGKPPAGAKDGTKLARANFGCLLSGVPISGDYIKAEGKAKRMCARLMAVVAEGQRGRVYLAPTEQHEDAACKAEPTWRPEGEIATRMTGGNCTPYGLTSWGDLFTPRQLVALTTFSDLVQEARVRIEADARAAWGAGVPPASPANGGQDGHSPAPGWYRRGDKHPPHYDVANLTQFVTFRLADTLPEERLAQWKDDLANGRITDEHYRAQVEEWLDRGMGACWLKDPAVATCVENALKHFDGERYTLHGWVVMPNHVHVVFSPHEPFRLADILHSWKSFTAKEANRRLGRGGSFWQEDYFDRFIRDGDDFTRTLTYVAHNPVVAGLCATPEEFPFAGGRASRPSAMEPGDAGGRDARPPSAADDLPLEGGSNGVRLTKPG